MNAAVGFTEGGGARLFREGKELEGSKVNDLTAKAMQTIFDDDVPEGALVLEIYRADHTAYSKKLGRVVMMRDAPDHSPEDFVLLSGTKVREMLGQGIAPPPEFSRPEVAEILMAYYQEIDGTAGN